MTVRNAERKKDRSLRDHRLEIIEAAAQAFMREGFASTSVDDIAHSLGCTKGRIYYYFKNKTDLFFSVHEETIEVNLRDMRPIASGTKPPAAKMESMIRQHIQAIAKRLPFQRVSLMGLEMQIIGRTTPRERQMLAKLMRLLREYEHLFFEVVEQGMMDGTFEKADADIVVKSLLGAMNWIIMWYRPRADDETQFINRISDNMTAYLIQGLMRKAGNEWPSQKIHAGKKPA